MSPAELRRRYEAGATMQELGRLNQIAPRSVRELIVSAGGTIRNVGRQEPLLERANARHLTALLSYGTRHGLPNMSPALCAERLREVGW
jgi:hypothetical protein